MLIGAEIVKTRLVDKAFWLVQLAVGGTNEPLQK
jgi:hypothetical protein